MNGSTALAVIFEIVTGAALVAYEHPWAGAGAFLIALLHGLSPTMYDVISLWKKS
jgi:hypothetical protein